MEKDNVCINCYSQVDKAAKILKLGQAEHDILTIPKRIHDAEKLRGNLR